MRIAVIGATGTIGSAVMQEVKDTHDVVGIDYSSGDPRVDLGSPTSIDRLFKHLGEVDALICAAGVAVFRPLTELKDQDFEVSLGNKLMGQINLVRLGREHITRGGTIVLTSGVLAQDPVPGSTVVSLVNAGLEGFARAAQLEFGDALRVRVVSPMFVAESMKALGMNPDDGIPAASLARIYRAALDPAQEEIVLDSRSFKA